MTAEVSTANPEQFKSESGKFKKYDVGQEIVFKSTAKIKKCLDSHNVAIELGEKIFLGFDGLQWKITDTFEHRTKDKFSENRAFALSGDASYSLRRGVSHMRKARQLLGGDIAEDTQGTMTEGLSEFFVVKPMHSEEHTTRLENQDQETILTDIESREEDEPEEPVDTARAFFARGPEPGEV